MNDKQIPEPTAFQRFDSLMRGVISVPKAEIDRRAAEYQKQRRKLKSQRKG